MPFKMVTNSEKAAGRIVGMALVHAEMIADEQAIKWADQLPEGEGEVSVLQIQRFHAEELRRLRQDLREKEAAHLDRLEEIRQARERRDAAVPQLRERLYRFRDLFDLVHGEGGPRALFLGKPVIPVDATPLRRVSRIVVGNLEDPELELPPVTTKVTELSRPMVVAELSEPLVAMETAMQELEDLRPLASASLEEKRHAHAAVDEKSAAFGRFLEGLYGLEGHDVLVAKVRPSSHRSKKESTESAKTVEEARVEDAREVAESVPESAVGVARKSSGPGVVASDPKVSPRPAAVIGGAVLAAPEGVRAAGGRRSMAVALGDRAMGGALTRGDGRATD